MWNTPVVFDPSNLDTIDPATDTDFAKAALNFRVSILREASTRPVFVKGYGEWASEHQRASDHDNDRRGK